MLSASIVRNLRVVLNVGRLYIFISLSACVRARISSTFYFYFFYRRLGG